MLEKWVPRLHLVEFEDLPWFPSLIRRYMQDFLHFMSQLTDMPLRTFAIRLRWAMQASGQTTIVDLCSGSGGPVEGLVRLMDKQERYPVSALLTDLYPNVEAMKRREKANPAIRAITQPVNAMDVPVELKGFRLMCNSFHHFDPESAKKVLGDAVAKNQGIAVIEFVSRSVFGLVQVVFGVMILMFFLTPFVRPFSFGRLFFTYVIPLVPIFSLWDGVASCFRVYSPDEMEVLIQKYRDTNFRWELGYLLVGKGPASVRYLIGFPQKKS